MRVSTLATSAFALLLLVGAGCSSSTNIEVDTPAGEIDAGAAGGTQLEGTPPENDTPDADINLEGSGETSGTPNALAAETGEVTTFTVTAANFAYDLKELKVKKGDKVRVVFKNAEGFHDFRIDEYAVDSGKLQAGGEKIVEFTADKAGAFEYYCSVGKHRDMGMKGNLIVE